MELVIITPSHHTKATIEWIEVTTLTGNIVIQPGHAPMITIIDAKKPIVYLQQGHQEPTSRSVVDQTIMHVTRTSVTLLFSE